jgi:isopentenyl phosphate kinase
MNDLVILKIGGSVCTQKASGKFSVRKAAVRRIAREIKEAMDKRGFSLLVVNGAGPFGHSNVAQYDINEGVRTQRDFEGFYKTVCDCSFLNWSIADIMRREGLHAYPFPTSSVAVQSGKKIVAFEIEAMKRMWDVDKKAVPVMNGTMVPDMKLGGSVISGDAVIEYLSGRLRPKLVVFATDVDGIFTADPVKKKNAKLIEEVTRRNIGDVTKSLSGSSAVDVTGGMLGKVERLLSLDSDTLIVNGNAPGRVKKALLGEKVWGTLVKARGADYHI